MDKEGEPADEEGYDCPVCHMGRIYLSADKTYYICEKCGYAENT